MASKRNLRFAIFAAGMLVLLAMAAFLPASAQLSQWRSLNPTRDGTPPPPRPFLYSVHLLSPTVGWAVGGSCRVYVPITPPCSGFVLYWDGLDWREVLTPAGIGTLTSVYAVSPNDVWAVGTRAIGLGVGTIIHWDGISWVSVTPPAGTGDLLSVYMLPGGTDGWAVGDGNPDNLRWSGSWPAGTWSPGPTADLSANILRSVNMLSPTSGWIVGDIVGGFGAIFRWDGAGWIATTSPTSNDLLSVYSVGANDAWAVGRSDTIIRWNGASWTGPMVSPTSGLDYRSIRIINSTYGWIAGIQNPTTNEGLLLRWDGTAWSIVRSFVTVDLNGLFMLPGGSSGAAVGNAETIIRWNGLQWLAQTSPTSTDLNAAYLVSANDGWSVGDSGSIFRWNGQAWHHYETLPSGVNLFGLFMKTSTDAWAVGANPGGATPPTILHWDGSAWVVKSPPGVALGETLRDVYMLSANEGWAVGTGTATAATMLKWDGSLWASVPSGTAADADLNSIHMLSSIDGWAVGDRLLGSPGIVVRWNGLAWSTVTVPAGIGHLRSVHFLSPNDGWAVGTATAAIGDQATIIHWDGAQWRRVPAPEGNLTSVHMVAANDGWAVGFDANAGPSGSSLIVHWDGVSWDVVATLPVPSTLAVELRSVFMTAALNGWIVSDQGLILRYGPEDVATSTITSTATVTSTITSTSTSGTTSTITTSHTTTTMPPAPIPGFPIESILAGLVGGLAALSLIGRRRRNRN